MSGNLYDVVVIGAGSGGLTAAVGCAKIGKKVLLVERAELGGECTNSGCIPSKALLHHAKAYYHATLIAGKSIASETFRTEAFSYVRSKINEILAEETPEHFEALGITVIKGEAHFVSPNSIQIGEIIYEYKKAIIATGSSPRIVPIEGFSVEQLLTNQNIFSLNAAPLRTLIIGAGPIGLEMGQALAMLGSTVTIATIDSVFGKLEDAAIQPILTNACEALGITIERNAYIISANNHEAQFERRIDGVVTEQFNVPFDAILMAIGRVPNLPEGLSKAGIIVDAGHIKTDDQYRTTNKQVCAIGDVSEQLKFTHTADDGARQVVARIASRGLLRVTRSKAVPKVTYTEPEIAQVGLSFTAAVKKYGEEKLIRIEIPLTKSDRARTDNATNGVLVVIAKRLTGAVVGAHMIGPRAGEIISLFTLAIDEKISLWKLQKLIYAYPTYSLIVKKAGDQFVAAQLNSLKRDLLSLLKRQLPKLIAGFFWLMLIIGFQYYRISNDMSYRDVLFSLITFFTNTTWGPLIYIVLYAVRPLILFPATLLTLLSGTLFGFWWGLVYTIVGENASANFAYFIGRFFGKDLRLEDTAVGKWVEALRKNAFETILLMRVFYVPFDLTNYSAGIIRARWKDYFLATLIGIAPGLTTFVALGAAIDIETFRTEGFTFNAFDPKFVALSVTIFTLSLLLSRFLHRRRS